MCQQIINESTNDTPMSEPLAQTNVTSATVQQPTNPPACPVDTPVLGDHIFLLLGID